MSKPTINGLESNKTTFLHLADDDGVWLHPTTDPNDLVELVENPYQWIKKVKILTKEGKRRSARLAKNFVISLDVATPMKVSGGSAKTAYVVDGIDQTGFITVRTDGLAATGTFHSHRDYLAAEEEIAKLNPLVVVAQVGDRVFLHVHLGREPRLRNIILAAAIENQEWLCRILGTLARGVRDANGNFTERKLTFTTRGASPVTNDSAVMGATDGSSNTNNQLQVIYQGSQAGVTNQDTCNVDTGTINGNTVTLDGVIIKIYPPT
jgi:hypothetical protein